MERGVRDERRQVLVVVDLRDVTAQHAHIGGLQHIGTEGPFHGQVELLEVGGTECRVDRIRNITGGVGGTRSRGQGYAQVEGVCAVTRTADDR